MKEKGNRCSPHRCCLPVRDGGLGLSRAAGAAGRRKSMSVQMRCHFIDDASGHFVQCWVAEDDFSHAGWKELDPRTRLCFSAHPLPSRGGGGQLGFRRGLGWPACWMPRSSVVLMLGSQRDEGAGAGFGLGSECGVESGRTGRRTLGCREVRRQSPRNGAVAGMEADERGTVCFRITGKALANWALGTQCSWERWELREKVRETSLSSTLRAPRVGERGAYQESGSRFAP